jgi:phosphate transport system substrate-binding protein
VKPVALAGKPDGPYFLPTRDTIAAGTYPLARPTYVFADRPPGKQMDPKVDAFLRYLLSPEGQADAAREGDYLPLDGSALGIERRKLE